MPFRYRILAVTAAVVLVLDQWTKWLVDRSMEIGQSIPVVENFFAVTYVRNKGAAFGMLSDSAFRIPFLITVAVVAAGGILWYLHRHRDQGFWHYFGLALIFSGAVGNLIDRLRFGEVIDFLDAHWYRHHWPAFNVADSAITVGAALLFVEIWLVERRNSTYAAGKKDSAGDSKNLRR